jgi:outer membrane protein
VFELSGLRLFCAVLLGLSFGSACSSSSGHIPKPPSGSVGVAGGYAIDFLQRTETFYQSVQDAQYKIQKGLVTRTEAEQLQQQLGVEEQNLQVLQNQYAVQLQEEGMVKNRQMLDKIETYVAELSASTGYSYVYSYSFGGNLIYGAKSLDITSAVVAGLNEKYQVGSELE